MYAYFIVNTSAYCYSQFNTVLVSYISLLLHIMGLQACLKDDIWFLCIKRTDGNQRNPIHIAISIIVNKQTYLHACACRTCFKAHLIKTGSRAERLYNQLVKLGWDHHDWTH